MSQSSSVAPVDSSTKSIKEHDQCLEDIQTLRNCLAFLLAMRNGKISKESTLADVPILVGDVRLQSAMWRLMDQGVIKSLCKVSITLSRLEKTQDQIKDSLRDEEILVLRQIHQLTSVD